MTTTIRSFAPFGTTAVPVTVEVDILRRLPSLVMVGLGATAVRETGERVRSAILNSGFEMPRSRVVVSVAPADLRKGGTGLDVAVAVAVLVQSGQMAQPPADALFYGELGLDGRIRHTIGAGTAAALVPRVGDGGTLHTAIDTAMLAAACGAKVNGYRSLRELALGNVVAECQRSVAIPERASGLDFRDVRALQAEVLDRILEAARTRRTILFRGPPGCGKTMLAARLPGLLGPVSGEEAMELLAIQDAARLRDTAAEYHVGRPFRAPHHSVSLAGVVGGRATLQPGEATLAHRGVLFLDEVGEFSRPVLDGVWIAHKDKGISVQVGGAPGGRIVLPSDFWLVAATNLCPCGYYGSRSRPCVCTDAQRTQFNMGLAHPLLLDAIVIDLPQSVIGIGIEAAPSCPSTAELVAQVAAG